MPIRVIALFQISSIYGFFVRLPTWDLVEYKAVRGQFRNRYWQSATTYVLVLLQVHLFLLIVFHHHNSDYLQNGPATVTQGRQHLPRALDTTLVCTTCLIIRHSPLRPTLGPQAPQIAAAVPLRVAMLRDHLPLLQRVAALGRAPPLA
jgi:hypothetical protein